MSLVFDFPECSGCGVRTVTDATADYTKPFLCAACEARADERARIRGWLGQQAGKAHREAKKAAVTSRLLGMAAAFKEAADHLKPPKVKAHLKRKRAARAVGK